MRLKAYIWPIAFVLVTVVLLVAPAVYHYFRGDFPDFVLELNEPIIVEKTVIVIACLTAITALAVLRALSSPEEERRHVLYRYSGLVFLLSVVVAAIDIGLCCPLASSYEEMVIALAKSKMYALLILLTAVLGIELALASRTPEELRKIANTTLFIGSIGCIALFPYVSYFLILLGIPWLLSLLAGFVVCGIGVFVLKKLGFRP